MIQLLDAAEDLRNDPNSPVSNEAPGALQRQKYYVLSRNDLWTVLRVSS